MNLEVASKINEELRTALDPKELESFARQIACGMVNSDKLLMFFMYKNNKTRLYASNNLKLVSTSATCISLFDMTLFSI